MAGLLLRIYGLQYQSLWIDESYSVTAAVGMIETGVPQMPSGELYTRSILNTGVIALSMLIFGINEFGARLPSVFFGVLTILIIYLLSRELFGERVALITAFIITFSVVEIAWSRQARMYQQLQFFYLLSLYLFYKYINTKELKFGLLTISSIICSILTHALGLTLLIILPAYYLLSNITNIKNLSNLKEELLEKRTLILFSIILTAFALSEIFFNAFSQVLNVRMDYSKNYIWYLKSFFPIIFYLAIPGIIIAFRDNWKQTLLPLLAFLIPLYFIFFHEKLLGYRYVFFVLPFMFLFFSKAIDHISRTFIKNKALQYLVIVIIVCLLFSTSLNIVPKKEYYLEPMAPQPDFISVYSYLQEHREPDDILISSYPEVDLWFNQTPDYWLAFSIAGFSPSNWMDETETVYRRTGTPAIKNIEDLEKVYENNQRGWLILDSLSGSRIPKVYWDFIKNNTIWEEGPSKPGPAGAVNLYSWDKEL
ncbi:MAG: glycosyltransferase family 39 protein [Methanophagales archaeon]|nr:glycosyltransferase family 39 protein [Methanophagales archaeon]